jgi:hypothetical protein
LLLKLYPSTTFDPVCVSFLFFNFRTEGAMINDLDVMKLFSCTATRYVDSNDFLMLRMSL